MAEDVKDDVIEIPTKRQKLDKDDDDYGIKQECTSSNKSATDKLVLSEDVPSTSSDNGPHAENELSPGHQQLPDPGDNMDDDSDSDISDISGLSETVWKTTPGAMAWVHRQMMLGQNPRVILRDLISKDADIDDLDDYAIWEIIIRLLSEPPKRDRLEEYHTLDHAINLIKSCKKIVVLTGAGVSVSCGIPDFRSRDGIYARLAVDFPNLPDPQAMFDINFFSKDQRPFFKFAKEIYPGQFEPSRSHKFIRLLETHEKLLRNYTQNIDTLEQVAGIERVIQCHGSFARATCMACKHKVTADVVREDIFNQVIPKCTVCPEGTEMAIMKPDIVFFGESLPEEFHQQMAEDKQDCDLLIVIGSSLKVRPVALIPNSLPQNVPQILINREPLQHLNFDIELLGDCDVIISELCKRLKDGFQVLSDSSPVMTEILRDQLRTPSPVPFPQNNPLESSMEGKVDNQEVPLVRSDHLSSLNDTEGKLETEKSSPSEGDKNKQDNAGKITNSENIENQACTDSLNTKSAVSQCLDSNTVKPPLENPVDNMDEAMPCDSTTEELRSMWQPERVSLAKYLEDGQYVHLPPNRYAFPGAEIFAEGESEDEEEHFRNSISMSSSSSCSSLNSHGNVEQSDEDNKSVEKQESNEEPINGAGKDSDDGSSDVRISSTDCDDSKHQGSRKSPTVRLDASSCHLDAEQEGVSQSCVGQTSRDVKLDIPSAQQPKEEDATLPDSSNSSM